MPTPVTMPRLGLSMVEGTVIEWRAKPGERVAKGQLLLLVESEKAEVEVEAFEAGVLGAVYVEPGRTVPIGELLGAIVAPGEAFDADAFAASFVPERAGAPATAGEDLPPEPPPSAGRQAAATPAAVKIAPAARALAKRLGLDPSTIPGSGPGGRVLPEDVERALEGLVDSDGVRLEAAARGEGPPVIFVNGFAVDAAGWRRQIDALGAAHRLISFELRGIGRSARGSGDPSVAAFAADAAAVLRHFEVPGAIVVGASLGAAVAIEIARRSPSLVRALVLLSPVFVPDVRLDAILGSWAALDDPAARARAMLPWILGRDLLADEARREAVVTALRAMAARVPAAALHEHRRALRTWLTDGAPAVVPVTVPVSVLVGDDDLLTPPDVAEALAGRLGATVERLPGAGHALMIERADLVNERIRGAAAASSR